MCKHCDGIRIARRDMLGLGGGGLPALLGTAAWADCAPMTVQSVPGTN